jgi:hypothetical protein
VISPDAVRARHAAGLFGGPGENPHAAGGHGLVPDCLSQIDTRRPSAKAVSVAHVTTCQAKAWR